MDPLDLSSGESPLEMQVESDERERQSDRLGFGVGVLRSPGVHDVLMDEGGVATSERVGLQLLERVPLREWGGSQARLIVCTLRPASAVQIGRVATPRNPPIARVACSMSLAFSVPGGPS